MFQKAPPFNFANARYDLYVLQFHLKPSLYHVLFNQ
jgi:hypothetical protein